MVGYHRAWIIEEVEGGMEGEMCVKGLFVVLGSLRKLSGGWRGRDVCEGEDGDEIMFVSLNLIFHSAFDH
jgi:hypothetical protein